MSSTAPVVGMDKFALRQFPQENGNTQTKSSAAIPCTPEAFVEKVNEWYQSQESKTGQSPLADGYAPFCKHLFVPNWLPGLRAGSVRITDDNAPLLRTEYAARTPKELPVLTRFFPKGSVEPAEATYLDVILYSRAQIIKENEAQGEKVDTEGPPWGIVSIKPQLEDYETPMQPITVLRNALGKDQGGSGVPLQESEYRKAVDYWSQHAVISSS